MYRKRVRSILKRIKNQQVNHHVDALKMNVVFTSGFMN